MANAIDDSVDKKIRFDSPTGVVGVLDTWDGDTVVMMKLINGDQVLYRNKHGTICEYAVWEFCERWYSYAMLKFRCGVFALSKKGFGPYPTRADAEQQASAVVAHWIQDRR